MSEVIKLDVAEASTAKQAKTFDNYTYDQLNAINQISAINSTVKKLKNFTESADLLIKRIGNNYTLFTDYVEKLNECTKAYKDNISTISKNVDILTQLMKAGIDDQVKRDEEQEAAISELTAELNNGETNPIDGEVTPTEGKVKPVEVDAAFKGEPESSNGVITADNLDLSRISSNSAAAKNGEFINESSIRKDSFGNSGELTYEKTANGTYLIKNDGVPIGFTDKIITNGKASTPAQITDVAMKFDKSTRMTDNDFEAYLEELRNKNSENDTKTETKPLIDSTLSGMGQDPQYTKVQNSINTVPQQTSTTNSGTNSYVDQVLDNSGVPEENRYLFGGTPTANSYVDQVLDNSGVSEDYRYLFGGTPTANIPTNYQYFQDILEQSKTTPPANFPTINNIYVDTSTTTQIPEK